MQKTILHDVHVSLGAKMAEFAGFDMPIQYTSVKDEVIAVRESAGVFDVSHMGEFFVEGPAAVDFVDYMMTNDFKNAGPNKAVYSPLCRENGTVIDDLIGYKISEEKVLICVNASNVEKDYSWFEKHVGQFQCKLSNHSKDYSLLALQGPMTEKIMKELHLLDDREFPYYSVRPLKLKNGESLILARTGYTGEDGFEIFCSNHFVKTLWADLTRLGAKPCGLASRDVLRLEVCYPLYGHELNDELTPLDSALSWTVKQEKEKFIAKEALKKYSPRYQLVKLLLEKAIPREGYPIYNDQNQEIGKVTSGTMSVVLNKGIAIAHVEKAKMPANKKLFIGVRKNILEATYQTKPFVTGGHK